MDLTEAEDLLRLAQRGDESEQFETIRRVNAHFATEFEVDPVLHKARLQAIDRLREADFTVPEIAEATGMKVQRIWDLLKDKRRQSVLGGA